MARHFGLLFCAFAVAANGGAGVHAQDVTFNVKRDTKNDTGNLDTFQKLSEKIGCEGYSQI